MCHEECWTDSILCDSCLNWIHYKCEKISKRDFKALSINKHKNYVCKICLQNDQIPDFASILRKLRNVSDEGYAELESYLNRNEFMKSLTDINSLLRASYFSTEVDSVSTSLLNKYDLKKTKVALKTSGDGSCLFHAVSVALVDNESLSEELRVRTAIDMIRNRKKYEAYKDFELVSLCSPLYEQSVKDCCCVDGYSSMWTMIALANVINIPIKSIYPPVNGLLDSTLQILNRTLIPNGSTSTTSEVLTIMWTSIICPKEDGRIWIPNHFVPVIERSKRTSKCNSPSESQKTEPFEPCNVSTDSTYADNFPSPCQSLVHSSSSLSTVSCSVVREYDVKGKPLLHGQFLTTGRLIEALTHDDCLDVVPDGLKNNCYFVIKNIENSERIIKNLPSLFPDDMGVWLSKTGASPRSYFVQIGNKMTSVQKNQGQFCFKRRKQNKIIYIPISANSSEENIVELRRYYATSKGNPHYKKRISYFTKLSSHCNIDEGVLSKAIVEYKGEFTEYSQHGNTKSIDESDEENTGSKFIRTRPATLQAIKQHPCIDAKKIYRELQDPASLSTSARDLKQVTNHLYLRKSACINYNLSDNILEVANRIHDKPQFVRAVLLDDHAPTIVLWTDITFNLMKNVCLKEGNDVILGIDRTFNMAELYVTAISYKHPHLLRKKTEDNPVLIGPILLHGNATQDVYSFFLHKVAYKLGYERYDHLKLGYDEEKAIRTSIRQQFPGCSNLLCTRHLKNNFNEFLQNKIGLPKKDRLIISNKVFSHVGLISSRSKTEFQKKIDELKKTFSEYSSACAVFDEYFCGQRGFVTSIWDGVVEPNIRFKTGICWMNNNSESLNHVMKAAMNWKSQSLPELVDTLFNICRDQELDITKALYGSGSWKLTASMRHHTISPQSWNLMNDSEQQKKIASFVKAKTPKPNTISSLDGKLIVNRSLSKGKKPNQQRRKRAEKTWSLPKGTALKKIKAEID